jgi:hypothetical protein
MNPIPDNSSQEAVLTDLPEPMEQYVQQEPTDELTRIEHHHLLFVADPIAPASRCNFETVYITLTSMGIDPIGPIGMLKEVL